jgi:8-oxo-dGTP pyrophosphatase MutT (NUDIX family)
MTVPKESGTHALLSGDAEKVFLVLKGAGYAYDQKNAGKVSMFGGKIEAGEDALAGLKRELFEELALDISKNEVRKLNVYQKTKEQDGSDVEVHVFVVKGIDPATLAIRKEITNVVKDMDANEVLIEGTPTELLARTDLSRITRLALEDLVKEVA